MHTTNYVDTFIAVAEDCPTDHAVVPPESESPSVALRTYRLIAEHPFALTSDDVVFTVHADRRGIPDAERPAARELFFSKGQPCLRSSALGKRYGWGIRSDHEGRVGLVGAETDEYRRLSGGRSDTGDPVTVLRAMRSSRR